MAIKQKIADLLKENEAKRLKAKGLNEDSDTPPAKKGLPDDPANTDDNASPIKNADDDTLNPDGTKKVKVNEDEGLGGAKLDDDGKPVVPNVAPQPMGKLAEDDADDPITGGQGGNESGVLDPNDVRNAVIVTGDDPEDNLDEDDDIEDSADMQKHIDALVGDKTLPEAFKQKAAAVFEAAVMERVTKEVARIQTKFDRKLAKATNESKQSLSKQVDGYLNYVVEQWSRDNQIALEQGLRNQLMENFMTGMRDLFKQCYIDAPAEKLNLVAKLESELAESKKQADAAINENIKLRGTVSVMHKADLIEESAEGLTLTEAEKFAALAVTVSYKDDATYIEKLAGLRESYFPKTPRKVDSVVNSDPVITGKTLTPAMQKYVDALDNK